MVPAFQHVFHQTCGVSSLQNIHFLTDAVFGFTCEIVVSNAEGQQVWSHIPSQRERPGQLQLLWSALVYMTQLTIQIGSAQDLEPYIVLAQVQARQAIKTLQAEPCRLQSTCVPSSRPSGVRI